MNKIHFFLVIALALQSQCDFNIKAKPYIIIEPVTYQELRVLHIEPESNPLNLTCSVVDNSTDGQPKYNITWIFPNNVKRKTVMVDQLARNVGNLIIPQLEQEDEGFYTCYAFPLDGSQLELKTDVNVRFKTRRQGRTCAESMFTCSLSQHNNCILRRYTCDGHQDCERGEDEHEDLCGLSPCTHKLPCQDNPEVLRCIPKSWCCDVQDDDNCTTKEPLSCCPDHFQMFIDEGGFIDVTSPIESYTVINGGAVVLLICVIMLLVFICRILAKNYTLPPRPPPLTPERMVAPPGPGQALYEVGMFCRNQPGLLVAYNIGEVVIPDNQPPSYSEIVPTEPKESPPPPYSLLDFAENEALLGESVQEEQPQAVSDQAVSDHTSLQHIEIQIPSPGGG